tara:strand:- start:272 stop:592 length:321 start_codon:yes stop_codon:yes gene_type:complete
MRDLEMALTKIDFPAIVSGDEETKGFSWFFEGGTAESAGAAGAAYFLGNNGVTGDSTDGLGDIFRANTSSLTADTTIATSTNASCTGPLTVSSSVTLTVNGTLVII